MKLCRLLPILGLCFLGCSDSSDDKANDSSPIKIAWIPKNSTNAVFAAGRKGAEKRAAELSASSGRTVEAIYLATESGGDQLTKVDEAIARKVQAINISCNDPIACATAIDKASAAGIQVMTWDSDSSSSKRYTYYSMNNKVAGQKAAQLMGKLLKGEGKVAVLTGVTYKDGVAQQPSQTTEDRYSGFRDELATNYANITVEVQTFCDKTNGKSCGAIVDKKVEENPDITAWFFIGNYPLTALPGEGATSMTVMPKWEEATKAGKIKSIAFDSIQREVELLKAGLLHVLVGQKYWDWGYKTVDIAYQRVASGKQFDAFIDTGYDIVCENNAEQVLQMWSSSDFSTALTPCSLQ